MNTHRMLQMLFELKLGQFFGQRKTKESTTPIFVDGLKSERILSKA
jgi:hypothetical protein